MVVKTRPLELEKNCCSGEYGRVEATYHEPCTSGGSSFISKSTTITGCEQNNHVALCIRQRVLACAGKSTTGDFIPHSFDSAERRPAEEH